MMHYYASRALRRLVLSAAGGPPSSAACVTELWERGLKGRCGEWAGSHGDKVGAQPRVGFEAACVHWPVLKAVSCQWGKGTSMLGANQHTRCTHM